jgi:heme oxygenase (biliverdin-producing, ferredoxin)
MCPCAVEPFKSTGLERGPALSKDIEWFSTEKLLGPLPDKPNGPGATYVELLQELAKEDTPAFICHYYNVYFAHTAGGRMIGKVVSNALLDGAELEFYKYDGDVKELGDAVKADMEALAATWTADERQRSVDETKNTFKYSGALLKCITQSCDCDCPRD